MGASSQTTHLWIVAEIFDTIVSVSKTRYYWPVSIVSVSFRYRIFTPVGIGIEVIDFESIGISINIDFLKASIKIGINPILHLIQP